LRESRLFPTIVLPSSVVNAIAVALPLPIVASLFGAHVAGQFALVWRVATVPSGLIASTVSDVFHAHATTARAAGPEATLRLVLRTMGWLAAAGTIIYVPICLISPWAFPVLFGGEWRPAGFMMLKLLPLWLAALVVSPVSRLPMILNSPGKKLTFDLCILFFPNAALYLLAPRGWDAAVAGYGIAAAAAYLVFGVLIIAAAKRGGPVVSTPQGCA
jgi:O-antigen/teichoic acid export membrane protein